jgi:hypothetical protein
MIASSVSTSIGSQPSSFSGLVVLRRTTMSYGGNWVMTV